MKRNLHRFMVLVLTTNGPALFGVPARAEEQAEPIPPEPAPRAGPEFLPLFAAGSLWTRYELRSGYEAHGLSHPRLHREGDYLVSRARLKLATNPVDVGGGGVVSGSFVPQAAYTFGENTGTTPTVTDHPILTLYEGYASVGSTAYRVDAGRFMMNYGDALVIGDLGWNEAARSFNGARVHVTPSERPYFADVFATLISEGRLLSEEPLAGDTYFYGTYAGLGPLIGEGFELDVYVLGRSTAGNESFTVSDPMDPTSTTVGDLDPATEVTVGARISGKPSPFDYRAEAGLQFGKRSVLPSFAVPAPDARSTLAYQVDAEAGFSPIKQARIGLEGLIASGDDLSTPDEDEGYFELFPTSHKFLGWADIVGPRTNVASAVLHLKYTPVEPLTLFLDAHHFSRLEALADATEGAMGQEIDTQVLYAIGKGASLRGMYAIYFPDQDFWTPKSESPAAAREALHYFELQFGYEFK
jgi:hypothetical protein